jgi:(2R)-ethylmalonyl-CoA mutase
MEAMTQRLIDEAQSELDEIVGLGGAFSAIEELKRRLVVSQSARIARIESGEQIVVGVNEFVETAESPLTAGDSLDAILTVDPAVEADMIANVTAWRAQRDNDAVARALDELIRVARSNDAADNIMPATLALAKAGGTTGEWAGALRQVYGEYRAPTGVGAGVSARGDGFTDLVARAKAMTAHRGSPPKLLVAKPGLDGHSNGAEQIAVAARDAGFEVVYQGIRLSPEEIVAAARDEDVDVIGISILSGSHLSLVPRILDGLKAAGVDTKVVVGGIIPDEDAAVLRRAGVDRVYTPKNFELHAIMNDLLDLVDEAAQPVGV